MKATAKNKFSSVDEYFSNLSNSVRQILQEIRTVIHKTAPQAKELMSYQMPAFKLNGILVWYGAFKTHIGFYPRASGILAFREELSKYKSSKGSVRFPLDQPMPLDLIGRIVAFRIKEDLQAHSGKKLKRHLSA